MGSCAGQGGLGSQCWVRPSGGVGPECRVRTGAEAVKCKRYLPLRGALPSPLPIHPPRVGPGTLAMTNPPEQKHIWDQREEAWASAALDTWPLGPSARALQ